MKDAPSPLHLNFASDNAGPVHPRIMEALHEANTGHALPYGADPWTAAATEAIRRTFEAPDAVVRLVPTGISANAMALSCLVSPWSRIFCTQIAHIEIDELGAVTLASGGAQLALLPHRDGRMAVDDLEAGVRATPAECHGALSLTQATEAGTLYTLEEIAALSEAARAHGMPVHMDGARWSNAVAALGCLPADMTWRAGVDVLSLGATKAGLMGAEAVVFFNPALAREADAQQLRMGLSLSKQRYLGAQLAAWLEGGPEDALWRSLADASNKAGAYLADNLARKPSVTLDHPVDVNITFARFPRALHRRVRGAGAAYNLTDTPAGNLGEGPETEPVGGRLVCDWSTGRDRIDALLAHFDP